MQNKFLLLFVFLTIIACDNSNNGDVTNENTAKQLLENEAVETGYTAETLANEFQLLQEEKRWWENAVGTFSVSKHTKRNINVEELQKKYTDLIKASKKLMVKGNASQQYMLGVLYYDYPEMRDEYNAMVWLRKSAKQGYAKAQTMLGNIYLKYSKFSVAKEWLEKAVAQGDDDAMVLLGGMYYSGEGIEKNYEKAKELFETAVATDEFNYIAKEELKRVKRIITLQRPSKLMTQALMKFDPLAGDDIEYEPILTENSNHILIEKEDNSVSMSASLMVERFESGEDMKELLDSFLSEYNREYIMLLTPEAESGNAEAQFLLGYYLLGTRYKHSEKWLTLAAEQGYVPAQYTLFQYYRSCPDPSFTAKDCEKNRAYWLKKALEQGYTRAQGRAGEYYLNGEHLFPQDKQKGMKLLQQAADKKDMFALEVLGHRYRTGKDVPKDIDKAVSFYNAFAAAEERTKNKGLSPSVRAGNYGQSEIYKLAYAYRDGDGVPKDIHRMLDLFEIAIAYNDASRTHKEVRKWADKLYNGDGIAEDKERAIKFYVSLAKESEDTGITTLLFEIAESYEAGNNGFKQNKQRAFELFKVIADNRYVTNPYQRQAEVAARVLKKSLVSEEKN